MKKYKTSASKEKKYIEGILLGDAGKASRRVACKRALSLELPPMRIHLYSRKK